MMRLSLTVVFLLLATECEQFTIDNQCNGHPEIVSRDEWRAKEPLRCKQMAVPVSHVIIIHTAMRSCDSKPKCIRQLWEIQDFHMNHLGLWDIAYNFLVGLDGTVYDGRGWTQVNSHTINFNTNSVGIAFFGNFTKETPSNASLIAAKELIKCGVRLGYLTPIAAVHGHRDVSCTRSPGDNLYKIIRTWDNYEGGRMPDYSCSKWYHNITDISKKSSVN